MESSSKHNVRGEIKKICKNFNSNIEDTQDNSKTNIFTRSKDSGNNVNHKKKINFFNELLKHWIFHMMH